MVVVHLARGADGNRFNTKAAKKRKDHKTFLKDKSSHVTAFHSLAERKYAINGYHTGFAWSA